MLLYRAAAPAGIRRVSPVHTAGASTTAIPTAAPMTVSTMRSRSRMPGAAAETSSVELRASGVTKICAGTELADGDHQDGLPGHGLQQQDARQQDQPQHRADDPLDTAGDAVPRGASHQRDHRRHHGPVVVPEAEPLANEGGQGAGESGGHEVAERLKTGCPLLLGGQPDGRRHLPRGPVAAQYAG